MGNSLPPPVITAPEIANYVVCPEAWRLKFLKGAKRVLAPRTQEGKKRRHDWIALQELSSKLKSYARIAYLLLFFLVLVIYSWSQRVVLHNRLHEERVTWEEHPPNGESNSALARLMKDLFRPLSPRSEKILKESCEILIIVGLIIFIWDLFYRKSRSLRQESGFEEQTQVVALQGSSQLPGKEYFSPTLGLSSKPNGLVRQEGFIIPVDVHPMTGKVKDRHIAQLLVHLRLIEEIEKKRPPYGILVMGPKQRQVRVKNHPEKQQWLETLLNEMRSIMDGVPAIPTPSIAKCRGCDVRRSCRYSAYREQPPLTPRRDDTPGEV